MTEHARLVEELKAALNRGYSEQLELLRVTDLAFGFLAEQEEGLTEEQILDLRILLAQAETMLGRYFGT